jgi:exosortase
VVIAAVGDDSIPRSRTSLTVPWIATGLAFSWLFWEPLLSLPRHWWTAADAGHGLLLTPLAVILAYRRGRAPTGAGQPGWGLLVLAGAIGLRWLGGLAVEPFTMRLGAVTAAVGLLVFAAGWSQVRHWWLSLALIVLSIPLPTVVLGTLALPLQLRASSWGAALLEWRHVPVRLAGNVILLPGHTLFVTEACSGLRSVTALIAMALVIAGLWLRTPGARVMLLALAIPTAMITNSVRIFLTGFLVFFVDPALGEGFMHYTEGWVLFLIGLGGVGIIASGLRSVEMLRRRSRTESSPTAQLE